MHRVDTVWQSDTVVRNYLTGTRGAIPLAQEQIAVMERLIAAALPQGVGAFLDLGCGDGVLGAVLLERYPSATGVFADFSPMMISAAHHRLRGQHNAARDLHLVTVDYSDPHWYRQATIAAHAPFDVVVSGFSIHHQPDERKWALYAEIFHLLRPGGIFVNLEHVASHSAFGHELAEQYMLDALWDHHRRQGETTDWTTFAQAYHGREDKQGNLLTPVETQCQWLREIGFVDVDCYLKLFELALFAGIKPKDAR